MSDRLDRDTGERMLRGEDTGPRPLAALLAAASASPLRDDQRGEEAAVAAFRAARSGDPVALPAPRRLLRPRALAVKTGLAGLALVLAGGAAVAASPHLRPSSDQRHPRITRTPAATGSALERRPGVPVPSPTSPRPASRPTHDAGHRPSPGQAKGKSRGHGDDRLKVRLPKTRLPKVSPLPTELPDPATSLTPRNLSPTDLLSQP
jgi:hypothetical protein